jgi:hypothetical protein
VITRSRERIWKFNRPFRLEGVDRPLAAGDYRVTTDEILIEGLSFPVYRRVATTILVPGRVSGSVEVFSIDPADLNAAHENQEAGILPDQDETLAPGSVRQTVA